MVGYFRDLTFAFLAGLCFPQGFAREDILKFLQKPLPASEFISWGIR